MEVSEVGGDRKSHGLLLTDDRLSPEFHVLRQDGQPLLQKLCEKTDYFKLCLILLNYQLTFDSAKIFHLSFYH